MIFYNNLDFLIVVKYIIDFVDYLGDRGFYCVIMKYNNQKKCKNIEE